MKRLEETLHDTFVEEIAKRLVAKGHNVELHVPYEHGECDILARDKDVLTYYEIKLHHGKHQRYRAASQLYRFASYCSGVNVRLVYVSRRKDGTIVAERMR